MNGYNYKKTKKKKEEWKLWLVIFGSSYMQIFVLSKEIISLVASGLYMFRFIFNIK